MFCKLKLFVAVILTVIPAIRAYLTQGRPLTMSSRFGGSFYDKVITDNRLDTVDSPENYAGTNNETNPWINI
jgi:hypothetical protein